MSNKSEYICPICGADGLCTDFTDGFKWGRAYCNSCDCGGPEVRTGYDENLDAPWRTEARKQFVEVVNEYVVKRGPWVKTADRVPTGKDTNKSIERGQVLARHLDGVFWVEVFWVETYVYISTYPDLCPYWTPIPPLPEVENDKHED